MNTEELKKRLETTWAGPWVEDIRRLLKRVEELEGDYYYELMNELALYETAIEDALNELGMPTLDTPAPVANAWAALYVVRNGPREEEG